MRLFIFGSLLLLFQVNLFGQSKDLKKANQLFKEDKYALAIPHYQKALNTKKNLSIKSKLAFCYKITNQMAKATDLYEEIVANDRAKTKSYFYYAETLMSSGQYELAKEWFRKYAAIEIDDETVDRMIAACDFAKTVQPYFGHATATAFTQNSEEDDNAPVFWDNGIVFTSDRKGKLKFLDTKSGATDRSYLRLYHSEALPDGTFGEPKEYISKINDARKNTGMATFQPNGSSMFFTRNGTSLNKQNAYCLQLLEAKSSDGNNWQKAEVIPFCRKSSNYMHPAISPDGKSLFFVSDKAGGQGGTDIYISRKQKNRWSRPENLGEQINTDGHEGFPFMHPNGKLYFCSKGHLGLGGFDIFMTETKEDGAWATPINLGAPINSPADDISIFIDEAEEKGVFTSSRAGGDDDIFLLSFIPQAIAINTGYETTAIIEKEAENVAQPLETMSSTINPTPIEMAVAKETKVAIIAKGIPVEKVPKFQEQETTITKEKEVITQPTDFLQLEHVAAINESVEKLYGFPTIYFSDGEYFVTYKIAEELDKAALILNKNPSLTIEVAAHTANLNSYEDKMSLTQKRANEIIDYLQRKGIDKNRLVAKGYGGQQPLNNCLMDIDCTVEEHAVNDRIEVKVVLKE